MIIRYVDYAPKRHKGMPIFAIEDGPEVDGVVRTVFREVTDPQERKAA
jgi:hypothetical protein